MIAGPEREEPTWRGCAFVYGARIAPRRLGLARPRKVSSVTFNFRTSLEKASLPISRSLSLSLLSTANSELGRRPSGPECHIVSRARVSDQRRMPLAEKKFFQRGLFREEASRDRIATYSRRVELYRFPRRERPLEVFDGRIRRVRIE